MGKPKKFVRAVIDLETMATCPRAIVIEAAVVFTDAAMKKSRSFSWEISAFAGDQCDRRLCADTLGWWVDRMKAGHDIPGLRSGITLGSFVDEFLQTWHEQAAADCEVWCQGADFDVAILRDVFDSYGHAEPWQHRKVRDLRTLKEDRGWKRTEGRVTAHRALQDAIEEMQDLREILHP
jgi:hypothetical protein